MIEKEFLKFKRVKEYAIKKKNLPTLFFLIPSSLSHRKPILFSYPAKNMYRQTNIYICFFNFFLPK